MTSNICLIISDHLPIPITFLLPSYHTIKSVSPTKPKKGLISLQIAPLSPILISAHYPTTTEHPYQILYISTPIHHLGLHQTLRPPPSTTLHHGNPPHARPPPPQHAHPRARPPTRLRLLLRRRARPLARRPRRPGLLRRAGDAADRGPRLARARLHRRHRWVGNAPWPPRAPFPVVCVSAAKGGERRQEKRQERVVSCRGGWERGGDGWISGFR